MKLFKTIKKSLIASIVVLFVIAGCSAKPKVDVEEEPTNKADAVAFDAEYTEHNGKTNDSGKAYLPVNVGEVNPYRMATLEEAIKLLKSGTGVIYFGFPTCPWCRTIVPVLTDVANNENIKEIYYVNMFTLRDVQKLGEDGKIIVEKEGSKEYKELVALLYDQMEVYEGLNDPSIKRLYVPTVVFVKEGKVTLYHVGTVESQEDPYVPMSEAQRKELYDIYTKATIETLREVCDTAC